MTFFNKKEEVLDIELTQFGKYLVSQGEFDPTYYAFFDDDIVYDGRYGGLIAETGSNQSSIEVRIKDVPRNHAQYVYTGIESQVRRNNRLIRTGELLHDGKTLFLGKKDPNLKIFEPVGDKNFSSYAPLGSSDLVNDKSPAWNIKLYHGEIDTSSIQLTSSATAVGMKIPQLNATIEYITSVTGPNDKSLSSGQSCANPFQAQQPSDVTEADVQDELYGSDEKTSGLTSEVYDEFEDDSRIRVKRGQIILKAEEFNTAYVNENFDVEVFEMTSSVNIAGETEDVWVPLYFQRKVDENGNYMRVKSEDDLYDELDDTDSSFVNYFLDLNADRDILEEFLCPIIAEEEKVGGRDIYDMGYRYICPDVDLLKRAAQIGGSVIEDTYVGSIQQEDIEECD
tara:strand:- start:357 stop:1544 length:1188 start_codon:yes stop_codon:yes gene_type:complete